MTIPITAVICTFNRANYLRKSLQSLVDQTLDPSLYEIIIIDNCSTDDTKKVVKEEFANVPNLRYIYEPVLGLSKGRNTAFQNAEGDYIAYLDDDAIAAPVWLEKILEVFTTVTPQPGCVGGKVEPIWEVPKPVWVPEKLINYYTIADCSPTPIVLNKTQFLVGANMSFPKKVLESIAQFQLNLDRKGKKLLSLGDNLLQDELRQQGYSLFYHPEVAVRHHISPARATKDWLLRRLYWEGVGSAIYQSYLESLSMSKRLRLALSRTKKLIKYPRQFANLLRPTDDPGRFERKCFTLMDIGYIGGILGIVK